MILARTVIGLASLCLRRVSAVTQAHVARRSTNSAVRIAKPPATLVRCQALVMPV